MTIALLLGVLVGGVLGLTGAGGGILAVPALVFGLGWTVSQAAPVALIAVAAGAAIGAIDGLRRGLVRYRAAMLMAAVGVPVTSLGRLLADAAPQRWLLVGFALVMILVAVRLARQALRPTAAVRDALAGDAPRVGSLDPLSGRFIWSPGTITLIAAIGAFTGLMTGLLGVGGGFVIVPLLRRYTALTMPGIVATSLLVIALVGVGGVATAVLHGAVLPPAITAAFAASTGAGMVVGRLVANRLSPRSVQLGFAAVVAVVALGMLVKALMGG